jgi:hypothetical protein
MQYHRPAKPQKFNLVNTIPRLDQDPAPQEKVWAYMMDTTGSVVDTSGSVMDTSGLESFDFSNALPDPVPMYDTTLFTNNVPMPASPIDFSSLGTSEELEFQKFMDSGYQACQESYGMMA